MPWWEQLKVFRYRPSLTAFLGKKKSGARSSFLPVGYFKDAFIQLPRFGPVAILLPDDEGVCEPEEKAIARYGGTQRQGQSPV
jgi:hypothetical protein